MPWIADVVPYSTILSTWGNKIRNQVVQSFASKAEMVAQAVPNEGMVCYVADTHITYVRVGTQWWVLAMPWRAFNPTAYSAPASGTPWSPLPPSSPNCIWRQSMGCAQAYGGMNVSVNLTNTDYLMSIGMPHPTTNGPNMGSASCFVPGRALVYGGRANLLDNAGTGGVMRVIVANSGPGVGPNAVINSPTGYPQVALDFNVTYAVDPQTDTP